MTSATFKVTAENLNRTPIRNIDDCLFTRAAKDSRIKAKGGVLIIHIQGKEAPIPPEALQLRARWEAGEKIEPFEFTVEY